MNENEMRVVNRTDYTVPTFWVDEVELEFDLDPTATTVTARVQLRHNAEQDERRLVLDGEHLELRSLKVDGKTFADANYEVSEESLAIDNLPDRCLLETEVVIHPAANKSLSGLYQSSGNFCTQCEAHGFRRITYFLDRPDVMAQYRVTLRADRSAYPILLSNGNRVSETTLGDGRQQVVWEDPFPKPSYLFALVAGDLRCQRGSFVTRSGRDVALEVWVEPQNIDRCEHAIKSLQKSMKWDEEVFGLEYDLDIYMIVAVNDFNMGAMENKGLNVFNSKYVLASPDTATDDDYLAIEAVIAHEYFHNWTGNRVTCRDWFQLTLKEGLTVFRDQQFTADQTSAAVKRIDDVTSLRSRQFLEDSGPMAHPIRPESYISMDNFYTATVYDKGAEIIRMYHTRLGQDGFRRGMDLYFERHDGQAVTCDDFRSAMADANDVNLDAFDRWYSQPGTPVLEVRCEWDEAASECRLTLLQSYPPLAADIPGAANRLPVPLPVSVGLLDSTGKPIPARLGEEGAAATNTILLESAEQVFTLAEVSRRPIASVLRNFSAPVRLRMERSREELAFLLAHDDDPFNRWDAGQTLATQLMLEIADHLSQGREAEFPTLFSQAFGRLLSDPKLDGSFKALALTLPSESVVGQEMSVVDPDAIHQARTFLRQGLANDHFHELLSNYRNLATVDGYQTDSTSINNRRLKSAILAYLSAADDPEIPRLIAKQFTAADNMTDAQAALAILANLHCPERDQVLADFYERWRTDSLVLDKWFGVQAASCREDTIDRVRELTKHPDFLLTNPNRVRSVLGVFAQNQVRFHRADGAGYRMLADFVLEIDSDNPQLSARLVSALNGLRRFDEQRQTRMRAELERIASHPKLSKDVYEIVDRALSF